MENSRNLLSTIGAQASPKRGMEPGVQKGKRFLLACHARCKCSMKNTHNSVKDKLGIKVMDLVVHFQFFPILLVTEREPLLENMRKMVPVIFTFHISYKLDGGYMEGTELKILG